MSRIAGVTTKKDYRGNITHVIINMKKHGEAVAPLLQQLGVVEKSQFQKDCEAGFSIDEALTMNLNHIDEIWKKIIISANVISRLNDIVDVLYDK